MTKTQMLELNKVRTREEALERAAPWLAVSWAGIAETAWYYNLGRGLGNTDNVVLFKNLSGTEKRELFIEAGRCLVKGSPEEAVNFVMAILQRMRTKLARAGKEKTSEIIAQARTLVRPDKVVALATRYGHNGVGVGHYCEFYIAPANRLANTGHVSKGRAIMQAGVGKGHITWPQMVAWEDFVKYTEKLLASNNTNTKEVKAMDNFTAAMIAEGIDGASEERQIEAWQYLVDTGLAWILQGCFGRKAEELIEAGIIAA